MAWHTVGATGISREYETRKNKGIKGINEMSAGW